MDPRRSLSGHAADVAPRLLGATLASRVGGDRVVLRITEVEAYGGVAEDPGSHAYRRMTPRNATMFGRAGLAYVYFTYGMHWCLCVVTGPADEASAVLVRAGEVVSGVAAARARRQSATSDRDLARGPARLTSALGVTGAQDGIDLTRPRAELRLALPTDPARDYAVSARTGVSGAGASTPWRFYLRGEPTVSPYRPAVR
ncbi:MAG: DNA-3-methyladenine glycosylase [Actinomycetota bacterium]|nr:DNA-3-methyladenine glycosylase [Actinomycetota bacterium]